MINQEDLERFKKAWDKAIEKAKKDGRYTVHPIRPSEMSPEDFEKFKETWDDVIEKEKEDVEYIISPVKPSEIHVCECHFDIILASGCQCGGK